MQGTGKRFVHVLRSDSDPERHYVGLTSDVENRLEWHNHGPCGHTAEHRPWSLVVVIEFPTEQQALRFERYMKSGSGRSFARRHSGPSASCQTTPLRANKTLAADTRRSSSGLASGLNGRDNAREP